MSQATPGGLPRWVEIPLAAAGLMLLSPLLLAAAVAVRAGSPGPILFRQQRIGRHGRPFELKKFRSMTTGRASSGSRSNPQVTAGDGPQVTAGDDPRVTRVGRVLRKTKVDELPELWNILVGDMSFVGPRPEVPRFFDEDDPLWQDVTTVRPGLTDPVTLRLRNEEDLLSQVDGDRETFYREVLLPWKLRGVAEYLRRRSAGSDILIIVKTVAAILFPSREPLPDLDEIRQSEKKRDEPAGDPSRFNVE